MDAYQKLRPWTDIESCTCDTVRGLILVDLLTDNPLHCSTCRREVDPKRLSLTVLETESVADWFGAASALHRLWLHSGAYEDYAKVQLSDPQGQINRDGIQLAHMLSARVPTRLWLFRDTDDGEPTQCPVCSRPLATDVKWGVGECPSCPVLV